MEMEHISDMLETMTVRPDFGWDAESIKSEDDKKGWAIIWEYLCSFEKFERLDNFIAMRRDDQLFKELE